MVRKGKTSYLQAGLTLFIVLIFVLPGPSIGHNETNTDLSHEKEFYIALEQAETLVEQGTAVFYDVRTLEEYQEHHIKEARLLPMEEVSCNACLKTKLDKYLQEGRSVILYDQTGSQSVRAYECLRNLGYENVYILEGGFAAWEQAKFPLNTDNEKRSSYPIDEYSAHDLLMANQYLATANEYYHPEIPKEDIDAWQTYATQQGWAFTIGETSATYTSENSLCGLIVPGDWWNNTPFDPGNPSRTLPERFDWREHIDMPPIRGQGNCGSCWAFATVAPLEANVMINQGIEINFSEQWLVSCNNGDDTHNPPIEMGCWGGWVCHEYHQNRADDCGNIGPVLETTFPYVGYTTFCNCPYQVEPEYRINYHAGTGTAVLSIKQAILDHGPVSTTVYVYGPFYDYVEGVYDADFIGTVNHAVVLVGWDDHYYWDEDYYGVWIMRNSWGPDWGEDGYMYITYGCCDIGLYTEYIDYPGPDCNSNNINDAMDIASGYSEDCNNNGVPDECDLGGGTVEDCNDNDIPDVCEIGRVIDESSGELSPIGDGHPQSFTLYSPPPAVSNVSLAFTAKADLENVNEYITVDINGEEIGTIFDVNGHNCPHPPDQEQLIVPTGTFNELLRGGQDAVITMIASDAVYFYECGGPYISVDVMYITGDCNSNGIPDECDITSGYSEDCNANSIPDECDIATGTAQDCNNNSIPDTCDIASGFSFDFNENTIPDECEEWEDCNCNNRPDVYELNFSFLATSPVLSPIDSDDEQFYTIYNAPAAVGDVNIEFRCSSDLSSSNEYITVYLNDVFIGTLYQDMAEDCEELWQLLALTAEDYNNIVDNGIAVFQMTPSSGVYYNSCSGESYIQFFIEYETATDYNGNTIIDECDILEDTSTDYNNNLIPDECEPDWNGNGYPDSYDINNGLSMDCNYDGIPDECVSPQSYHPSSAILSPIYYGNPQEFTFNSPSRAISNVTFTFTASADLESPSESIEVFINDVSIGDIFEEGADDCADPPNVKQIILSAEDYNTLIGTGPVTILMNPSSSVGNTCDGASYILVDWFYDMAPFIHISPTFTPLDRDHPYEYRIPTPPRATSNVILCVSALGDLESSIEEIDIYLNDEYIDTAFDESNPDWGCLPALDHVTFAAEEFNTLVAGVDAIVQLIPSTSVSPEYCESSFIQVSLYYKSYCYQQMSLPLSPLGDEYPLAYTFSTPPLAEGDIFITCTASGDIGSGAEEIEFTLNGEYIDAFFSESEDAEDCSVNPLSIDQIVLPAEEFNTLINGSDAVISLEPSSYVNPFYCEDHATYITLSLQYDIPIPYDCNENGIPDDCDIASGTSLDENENGIPDECEGVIGDVNGDGVVDILDLLAVLAAWGECVGCPEDINSDGVVDILDLLEVLAHWS